MPVLITDFDGTFVRRDFFDLILERYDPPAGHLAWRRFLDGESTLTEGLAGVFGAWRASRMEAESLVELLDPAPGTAAAVRRLQASGWEVIIASAGCSWYIERLLQTMGLHLTVHARPGVFSPETGLVLTPDAANPFHHPQTGIDKARVVRDALSRDPVAAYAGDSTTDRAGAMLVPPERRFITGWLARRFAQEGVPHTHLDTWPQIADSLLKLDDPPRDG